MSALHERMLETLIAEPGISKVELARRFGRTAQWVYRITGSECFQTAYAERQAQLRAATDAEFRALLTRSLAIMKHKLAADPASLPDATVLRALELTAKACGYGRESEPAPAVEINMNVHLQQLSDNMVRMFKSTRADAERGEAIDAEPAQPAK